MKKYLILSLLASVAHAQNILPASYDLRAEGLAPAIQNQGDSSICWAVASCTAIESNLLKKGAVTPSPTGDLHVSAWHMAVNTGTPRSLIYNEDSKDYERDEETVSWGGEAYACNIGYLTRGRLESGARWEIPGAIQGETTMYAEGGTVSLQGDPSNRIPFATWSSHEPMTSADMPAVNQPVAFLCRGLYTIQNDDPSTQVQAVKQSLTDYGAVTTGIYISFDDDEFVANSDGSSYYYNFLPRPGHDGDANHEVTIIGWDDNYVTATGTGAWIIQNSWGESLSGKDGDEGRGVFYVSYNDVNVGQKVTAFNMELGGQYSDFIVQNDPMLLDFDAVDEDDFMASAEGYKAASLLDLAGGTLGALGLLGKKDQVINVNLYLAAGWGEGGNRDVDQLELLYGFDAIFDESGYSLFDLGQFINISDGALLLVMLDYGLSLSKIEYVPFNSLMNPEDYEGLSYYFDGVNWIDTATAANAGMYFIKGYLLAGAVPEPATAVLALLGLASLASARRRTA